MCQLNLVYIISVLGFCLPQLGETQVAQEPCITPEEVQGKCTTIHQCPSIQKMLQGERPLPTATVEYLKKSHCGFDGRTPYICCPKTDFLPNRKPSKNGQRPIDVRNHPSLRLLPESCGPISETKITNGNETNLYEFPWMALLGYYSGFSSIRYRCGGSLITEKYVLTAAHCIQDSLVSVRLGEYDQGTESDCQKDWKCAPPVQDFDIEKYIVHPQYNKKELMNDIALIKLEGSAIYNIAVQPICLPVGKEQWKSLEGESMTASGWGTTEFGTGSQVLLKVDLPVVNNKECADIYKSIISISEKQLCAGGKDGKDSCSGDSGGPLQFVGQTMSGGFSYIQYGIVSFGPLQCGLTKRPGVYTRIGHYMDWVLNNIK